MGLFRKDTINAATAELKTISEVLIEDFRFTRSFRSAVDKLFAEEKKKYESAYNFHRIKMEEFAKIFNLRMIFFDGKEYDDGMPVTPLNIGEFGKDDILIVQQTIEPTILTLDGSIVKVGTVILSTTTTGNDSIGKIE